MIARGIQGHVHTSGYNVMLPDIEIPLTSRFWLSFCCGFILCFCVGLVGLFLLWSSRSSR